METLKTEHEKKLKEQSRLIEVSGCGQWVWHCNSFFFFFFLQRYQQRNVVVQLKTMMNEADTDSEVTMLMLCD